MKKTVIKVPSGKPYSQFKACLFRSLEPIGFVRNKDVVWRRYNDAWIGIGVQADKNTRQGQVSFTIQMSILLDILLEDRPSEGEGLTDAHLFKAHWSERLGFLLPEARDTWWIVTDTASAERLCKDLSDVLLTNVLPKIETLASTSALIELWQSERGPGLTKYARRSYLAEALVILGRYTEAREALEKLTEESNGKSWQALATRRVKQLSERIERGH